VFLTFAPLNSVIHLSIVVWAKGPDSVFGEEHNSEHRTNEWDREVNPALKKG